MERQSRLPELEELNKDITQHVHKAHIQNAQDATFLQSGLHRGCQQPNVAATPASAQGLRVTSGT